MIMKTLAKSVREYKKEAFFASGFMVLEVIMEVLIPFFTASLIDLGIDGGNLSSGQRQLLSIARAAAANPPVMILDEATSSIDTRTEAIVQKGMDGLMDGRTVFVIAHRLSTVKNSKAIMVLEQGQIVERGNHDELIKAKGRYYQLYTVKASK